MWPDTLRTCIHSTAELGITIGIYPIYTDNGHQKIGLYISPRLGYYTTGSIHKKAAGEIYKCELQVDMRSMDLADRGIF